MTAQTDQNLRLIEWQPQPAAAALVGELLSQCVDACPDVARFAGRLSQETGTRLADWIDHIAVPVDEPLHVRLGQAGFVPRNLEQPAVWEHPAGLFPQLITRDQAMRRLAIRVESVADFLAAMGLGSSEAIAGAPLSRLRKAPVASDGDLEFWAVERHGYRGWETGDLTEELSGAVQHYGEAFVHRRRRFDDAAAGFEHARNLIASAVAELGTGRAADLFFAAERQFWTDRNRAACFQKNRQDALGLGWANHDHHTYRSSREHFAPLMAILEDLGFQCRERFYAGREAGWGAQVLEQEESQVVIFADVDLSADEVTEDFAHAPLPPRAQFGTVGLWCLLHGEAFLDAGMHHLECRFDFDAAREQFQQAGFTVMRPFTDFPYLKQAFTAAEPWKVEPARAATALAAGAITAQQAEQFCREGALGSHLEILQRDDGYKGFNQTGINEIIRATDPRGDAVHE